MALSMVFIFSKNYNIIKKRGEPQMNWKTKIQRFMMNRYGPDELYKFLFELYIILIIMNLFINSKVLTILELFVVIIMLYRFFSKNISKRRKENNQFLKVKKQGLKPFRNIKRNYQDRDYYVYKKCHQCKSTLKLPLPPKRGIQHVKCPTCKNRITFICLRQEKVEVIKKRKK